MEISCPESHLSFTVVFPLLFSYFGLWARISLVMSATPVICFGEEWKAKSNFISELWKDKPKIPLLFISPTPHPQQFLYIGYDLKPLREGEPPSTGASPCLVISSPWSLERNRWRCGWSKVPGWSASGTWSVSICLCQHPNGQGLYTPSVLPPAFCTSSLVCCCSC